MSYAGGTRASRGCGPPGDQLPPNPVVRIGQEATWTFWYVIVQPRIDELSITVRGAVDHFEPVARLEIKDDRGNTRFKVKSKDDLPAALQIIFHAIRKG